MITRYATSILLGSLIALGLLFLMQSMIAGGRPVMKPDAERWIFDFVVADRPPPLETLTERPERAPEPERRPEPNAVDGIDDFGTSLAISMTTPSIGGGAGTDLPGFGLSDGDYLPVVTVAPIYPAAAVRRELEGHVVVEFTVTRTGSTRDPRIVESTSSLFERAALDSALKYRYRPRVINGEPVEVPGVRTLIRFVLEN